MTVRCKFVCKSVLLTENGGEVTLAPVVSGSAENESFFKWTPYGEFKMGLVQFETAKQFTPGVEYFIDITEA